MVELITLSGKGQITVPQYIREKLNLKSGDKMFCDVVDGCLVCKKPVDFFSLEGCVEGAGPLPENEEELFVDAVAEHVMECEK